jgi:TM2 domain-containing membrane protein YozV
MDNTAKLAHEYNEAVEELSNYSDKSQIICLILCVFFAGAQYYYTGRIGRGLLYTFTGGFLFIGTLVDFFIIASGNFKDKDGKCLNDVKTKTLLMKIETLKDEIRKSS